MTRLSQKEEYRDIHKLFVIKLLKDKSIPGALLEQVQAHRKRGTGARAPQYFEKSVDVVPTFLSHYVLSASQTFFTFLRPWGATGASAPTKI